MKESINLQIHPNPGIFPADRADWPADCADFCKEITQNIWTSSIKKICAICGPICVNLREIYPDLGGFEDWCYHFDFQKNADYATTSRGL